MKSKKQKTVDKLQSKKGKVIAKMTDKKTKIAGVAGLLCFGLLMGCQQTPSRANINEYTKCNINVFLPVAGSNQVASAVGYTGDMFAQAMVVENSGTESLTPQQTVSTPTQLSYGVGTGGGSSWGDLFSGLASLFKSKEAAVGAGVDAAAGGASASAAGASCGVGGCSDK